MLDGEPIKYITIATTDCNHKQRSTSSVRLKKTIMSYQSVHLLADDDVNDKDLAPILILQNFLDHADQILTELERDRTLGPAIRRFAWDLATLIGSVARDWENTDEAHRKQWARTCLEDAHAQLELHPNSVNDMEETWVHQQSSTQPLSSELVTSSTTPTLSISHLSEEELIDAVSSAKTLLLDVEASLKSIGADESEEIADVALVVARIFLWSLQHFYDSAKNHYHSYKEEAGDTSSHLTIEEVTDELKESHFTSNHSASDTISMNQTHSKDTEHSTATLSAFPTTQQQRIRFLWPPLSPLVSSAASWSKDSAVQNPILSIALAMTLWPMALLTCFVGTPIVLADWAIQEGYNSIQNHPIVENVERGTANLYSIGKFYYLCSKLVIQQGIRVGIRQIERRGGVGNTVQAIGSWTLDRILHPVETITWGSSALTGTFHVVMDMVHRNQHGQRIDGGVDGTTVPSNMQ